MKTPQKSPIATTVMDEITHGAVRMRPRTYYTLLLVALLLAVATLSFSAGYALDIVTAWVPIQFATTPAYGARLKLATALQSFPWWAVIAAIIMIAVAAWLVKLYGRMYRHKTSTIVAVLVGLSLLIGLGISLMGVGPLQGQPGGQHHGTQRLQTK